ncbi:helix-turn-helix domain-containing protein [Microcoleus sp. D3_18_C4]|uniref:helix-turn-helix domain-containing protein n=1 Tax=Microcoleus sp. D3_18_C4 TaxID=3055335 RepID=UPI002FD2DB20
MLKKEKTILAYNKVQMLYLFQSKQVEIVREVSAFLGKSEATIHRWLSQYRKGGLENLLKNRQVFGRPKKFSVEIAATLQQELRDPEGFKSYKEVHLWLWLINHLLLLWKNKNKSQIFNCRYSEHLSVYFLTE